MILWLCMLAVLLGVWTPAMARNTHGSPDPTVEDQAWWGDAARGYVASGCLHPTTAGTTVTVPVCKAYVHVPTAIPQLRFIEETVSRPITFSGGDGAYWLAGRADLSAAPVGWTCVVGTHYCWILSASIPVVPSDLLLISESTVAVAAVTTVRDRRTVVPWTNAVVVTASAFGAKGDGVTDDTVALRAAVAAGRGRTVIFPSGTYLIGPTDPALFILPLLGGTKIRGEDGAILKIKNNGGDYWGILGAVAGVDTSGTVIEGLEFDHNSANNAITAGDIVAGVLVYHRFSFNVLEGSNITVRNCTFRNESNTNSVVIGQHETSDNIEIAHNRWINVGANPNNLAHDNSPIYVRGHYAHIHDNTLDGAVDLEGGGDPAPGAVSGIETHASRYIITGNIVRNFQVGMNVTGITLVESRDQLVSNNTLVVQRAGIRLFSIIHDTHTTGFGLDNILVSNNQIRLYQKTWTGTTIIEAIGLRPTTLDARSIAIWNNQIEYDLESAPTTYTSFFGAVGANTTAGSLNVEHLSIRGNRIVNAPVIGIIVGSSGGTFNSVEVLDNIIINAGQSQSASVTEKTAIYIKPTNMIAGAVLDVSRNRIMDTFATTRLVRGIRLESSSAIPADVAVRIEENTFWLTGATQTAFTNQISLANNNITPYFTGQGTMPWVRPLWNMKKGSTYLDTTTSRTEYVDTTGTLWITEYRDSAPPTSGTFNVGSRVWNTVPSDGDVLVWVNTSQGTPGTWRGLYAKVEGTSSQGGDFAVSAVPGLLHYSNATATGTITATLPVTSGTNNRLRLEFTRVAAFAFRIDPAAGETISGVGGFVGGAGKYLSLDEINAHVEIESFGGTWRILNISGTATFEP